ncbi:hypothetical protein Gasu2_11370 [Galdieria sulphuraria]|nr:hypothetical protein Gasu2_11370 [Galdieria sulphuraria]
MESPTRKEEKQQPPTASSSEQEQTEQEKLPSFRNLMAEIQGVLESSTTQETPSTQVTQRIQIRKRPRVEAPFFTIPGLRTAEYPLQSVEQLRVGETTYEGRKFVEEGTVVPQEGSTLERSHSAAREARRHRRQILTWQSEKSTNSSSGRVTKTQPTVTTSTEQTSPIIPTEFTSRCQTSETEDHEEKKSTESIKESEAGPSSTPSFKRGRGRKREHPEWTEEQRQAQRIMKNREAAERARQRRKEREESLLRELTSAIERNRLLEEEIQRLRNLLKEVLPTSSGKNSQERSK